MGWVEDLRGKTVGLDTARMIYYIEDHLATAINHRADAFLTGDRDFGDFNLLKILRVRDLALRAS